MLRNKSLIILAITAIVLVAVAMWSRNEPTEIQSSDNKLLLPDLMAKINAVKSINIKSADKEFSVQKTDNGWAIDQKNGYPADTEKVRALLLGMARTKRLEAKTKNPELYAKLQLQDVDNESAKSILVSLVGDTDESLADVVFGKSQAAKADSGQREYYVRISDDPQSWLVQSDFELEPDAASWLAREVLKLDESRIRSAVVNHDDDSTVQVQRESSSEANFALADVPENKKIKYEFAVNDVAKSFSNLDLDDVVKADDVDFSAAKKAIMQSFDGLRITLEAAEKDDVTYARLQAEFDPSLVSEDQSSAEKKPEQDANAQDENSTETGVQVQATLKSADEIQQEVETLNARWSGWAYQLPDFELNNIFKPLNELLEDIEAADGEEASTDGDAAAQD